MNMQYRLLEENSFFDFCDAKQEETGMNIRHLEKQANVSRVCQY